MKTLLIFLIAIIFAINVYAQPNTITYQGVLTNAGGAVVTETPNITFDLFDSETNGNQLWTETHNNVSVTNGLFKVELNSVNSSWGAANFASNMWLQITVGATTLNPRVKFNANGYSFNAGSATTATTATTATNLAGGEQGSIPYQTAAGTTTLLAAGTNGHVLTLTSGVPTWSAGGITVQNTPDEGDLVYYSSGNWIARRLTMANTGLGTAINNMQPFLALNYCIALYGIFPSRSSDGVFIGEIDLFAFDFAPRNYAMCNGQFLSIAQNTALFALIGTIYGGDGQSTFQLPDLRGRVPMHYGQGAGLSYRNLGESGGTETVTITIPNLPVHNHVITYEN